MRRPSFAFLAPKKPLTPSQILAQLAQEESRQLGKGTEAGWDPDLASWWVAVPEGFRAEGGWEPILFLLSEDHPSLPPFAFAPSGLGLQEVLGCCPLGPPEMDGWEALPLWVSAWRPGDSLTQVRALIRVLLHGRSLRQLGEKASDREETLSQKGAEAPFSE